MPDGVEKRPCPNPVCGRVVPEGATRCPACGTAALPAAGAEAGLHLHNSLLRAGEVVIGTKVVYQAPEPSAAPAPASRWPLLAGVAAVALLALLAVVSLTLISFTRSPVQVVVNPPAPALAGTVAVAPGEAPPAAAARLAGAAAATPAPNPLLAAAAARGAVDGTDLLVGNRVWSCNLRLTVADPGLRGDAAVGQITGRLLRNGTELLRLAPDADVSVLRAATTGFGDGEQPGFEADLDLVITDGSPALGKPFSALRGANELQVTMPFVSGRAVVADCWLVLSLHSGSFVHAQVWATVGDATIEPGLITCTFGPLRAGEPRH